LKRGFIYLCLSVENFYRFLRRHFKVLSTVILIFFFVSSIGSVWFIYKKVFFSYELETFFPENDPSLDFYVEHLKHFESDHDVLLLALTNDKGIFNPEFLNKVNDFSSGIRKLPHVKKVISPVKMVKYAMDYPNPRAIPFFHPNNPKKLREDSILLANTDHFVKQLVVIPANTIVLVIKTEPQIGVAKTKVFLKSVEALVESSSFDKVRMAGRVKAQLYIIGNMQKEFFLLAGITVILLIGFLWITFRNFWGVVLPIVTVVLGLVFTLDFMILFGDGIDILSIIIPTILFVVGVSDSVHILNNYYSELRNGVEKKEALVKTIRDIGFSTFLTAVTSAVGFATLITINILPIYNFGVSSAVGILLVYFISFTFLIAALYFLPPFHLSEKKELIRHGTLEKLFKKVSGAGRRIALIFLLALIPLSYGISRIVPNNYFTEELRPDDPYKTDFMYFDDKLGGVRPFELSVKIKRNDVNIFSREVSQELYKMELYLQHISGVGDLASPNTILRSTWQMLDGGKEGSFILPPGDSAHAEVLSKLAYAMEKEELTALVTPDLKYGRISGRIKDLGAVEVERRMKSFEKFMRDHIDNSLIEAKVTGISTVLDSNNKYLTANLMEGLIYELLAIGLLMALLFRSFRVMLISLIPNIFPLMFIGGLMGLLGIHLNMSSSIIFNIAFGITVDDTIHLLAGYKLYLLQGMSKEDAILRSYVHSGKAVAMTSFILFGGFVILMLSDFTGIFNTGLLVSFTLVIALLSDLLLLPSLVKWLHR
jgi:uncharacterized protein